MAAILSCYFASVKEKLVRIISTGQLGIFKNGYWGIPATSSRPRPTSMLVAHYIEALDFQKDVVQIHTVFGGKEPPPQLVGGRRASGLNINGKGGADVINMERLELVLSIIKRCVNSRRRCSSPTASPSPSSIRSGCTSARASSNQSLLAYGAFPSIANDYSQKSLLIPGGAIINGNFNEVLPVDLSDEDQIREEVGRSWYTYPKGVTSLHPYQAKPCLTSSLDPPPRGAGRTSSSLMKTRPIRGSRHPAGAAT